MKTPTSEYLAELISDLFVAAQCESQPDPPMGLYESFSGYGITNVTQSPTDPRNIRIETTWGCNYKITVAEV